jgi:hypothetical protein
MFKKINVFVGDEIVELKYKDEEKNVKLEELYNATKNKTMDDSK